MVNCILVASGGLDSSVLAYYIKNEIKPKKFILIFFDYGQRALKEELFCVREIAKDLNAELKIIGLGWLGKISTSLINKNEEIPVTKEEDLNSKQKGVKDIGKWWVPCRNALFLLIALAHAESYFISNKERYDVYIGIKDEGEVAMKDTTPEFLKAINELTEHCTKDGGYKIKAPFLNKDKVDVVKLGERYKINWLNTYSCYKGEGFRNNKPVHCGYCENCMLRKKAFYWANVEDVSLYKNI